MQSWLRSSFDNLESDFSLIQGKGVLNMKVVLELVHDRNTRRQSSQIIWPSFIRPSELSTTLSSRSAP